MTHDPVDELHSVNRHGQVWVSREPLRRGWHVH